MNSAVFHGLALRPPSFLLAVLVSAALHAGGWVILSVALSGPSRLAERIIDLEMDVTVIAGPGGERLHLGLAEPTRPTRLLEDVQSAAPLQGETTGGPGGPVERAEAELSRPPRLLNGEEVSAGLGRFYPADERRGGREGEAALAVHIDESGRVARVDVLRATSPAFAEAAHHVAGLQRFAPGFVGTEPVPVRMRQAIEFRLGD